MRVQNTITFIISRNYGRPLSLSLPAWLFYALLTLGGLLLLAMVALSVLFIASYPRVQQIREHNDELRQERDALREQLHSRYQQYLERKEQHFVVLLQGPAESPETNDEPVTGYSEGEDLYQPPIRVDSLTTRVTPRAVEVAFKLENQGDANNRGGFLYAIFANEDKDPVDYLPSPSVNVNAMGFPQSYKSGVRFTRIRDTVTFRRKVRRDTEENYFTHVTLFLFSVRGGLLVKERFELDRSLFTQDRPVVRTQTPNI